MVFASSDEELVVLVDQQGQAIGSAAKAAVHTDRTPLHRAFSCYLFNPGGQLLLTRRSTAKRAFPGLWTNSVCGHPGPGESDVDAIHRRAQQELGLIVQDLTAALPEFRYRAESAGVVENEICPVYLGRTNGSPDPVPDEVDSCAWTSWDGFLASVQDSPDQFSPWCRDQSEQLQAARTITRYLRLH